MKVKDVIALLQKMDQEEELVIGWWRKDFFKDIESAEDDWSWICSIEDKLDWSPISAQIKARLDT